MAANVMFLGLILAVAAAAQSPDWWQCTPCRSNDPAWTLLRRQTVNATRTFLGQTYSEPVEGMRIGNARELAAVLNSNYATAPIFVARLLDPPGFWLIAVSGVQLTKSHEQASSAMDGFLAARRQHTDLGDLVMHAWSEMRIPLESLVVMAGHSLGGMEAENLVFHPNYAPRVRARVHRIVTFGAPAVRYLSIDRRDIRRFVHPNDYIIGLLRRYVPQSTSQVSEAMLTKVPYSGANPDAHNAYHDNTALERYDTFGDPEGGRTMVIDSRVAWRCRANRAALAFPIANIPKETISPRGMPYVVRARDQAGTLEAIWPDAPAAARTFRFSTDLWSSTGQIRRTRAAGFEGVYIRRGNAPDRDPLTYQPSYSAARMSVDAMRAAGVMTPAFVRFANIVEPRTQAQVKGGVSPRMQEILAQVMKELEVDQYRMDSGRATDFGLWFQAEILSYTASSGR